jgi:hypothetical protein
MSTVEDKLRQALEATASEIRATRVPTMGLVPLTGRGRFGASVLHAVTALRRRCTRWASVLHAVTALRRRRARWAAPVAATAAVAVVVGLSAAIGAIQHDAGSSVLTRLGPGTTVPLGPAPAVDGGAVPAYYVVIHGPSVEVLATATGNVLATVRSAAAFIAVSGAADDRTFVLAAARKGRIELYLLRLNPQAGTARLNALPIAVATGSSSLQFAGLALSPDGSKVAVAINSHTSAYVGAGIWVFNLATGSRREWRGAGAVSDTSMLPGSGWLSWAADDTTLAFDIETGVFAGFIAVRLLDTAAPGTDLSRSRVVLSEVQIEGTFQPQLESPLITGDGRAIVLGQCEAAGSGGPGCPSITGEGSLPETLSIDEYSARTGHRIAIPYQRRYDVPSPQSGNPGPPPSVLWANAFGKVLIVSTGAPVAGQSVELGIVRHGTFTPLRAQGTALTGTAAW